MSTKVYQVRVFREPDDDQWWTVEVPELTSPGPGGATIVATGGSVTARGIERAARELVAAWLDVATNGVRVHVGAAAETEGRGDRAGRGSAA